MSAGQWVSLIAAIMTTSVHFQASQLEIGGRSSLRPQTSYCFSNTVMSFTFWP